VYLKPGNRMNTMKVGEEGREQEGLPNTSEDRREQPRLMLFRMRNEDEVLKVLTVVFPDRRT